jgi:putative phosphoribosyl transferase
MFVSGTLFKDRQDAAQQLAARLKKYKGQNTLVLGIPRGGVEVGYYIAKELEAELSVVISKKIPHPLHPEFAIGAICEEGTVYINDEWKVSEKWLATTGQQLKQEIQRRVQLYRGGNPLPYMKDRVVILVDDGIATGATLASAMLLCVKHEASRIVVAVPVSGGNFVEEIYTADELVILHQPGSFLGVGSTYDDFSQLTDEEVLSFLKMSAEKNEEAL